MAFIKPSIKEVKTTMESALMYIRSERKWGKSTLFRNIILQKFGDPTKGMLVGCGDEEGYNFLDSLNSTQITNYKDLFELKNWLIQEKGKEHNIEIVGFDVVDELVPMFEDYSVKLSIKETGKPCKSVNEAFGGFHKGQKRAAQEIKRFMKDIQRAGIGVFAISHTKNKTIKPQGCQTEEDGYMTLTSTLESTYESVFGDIFDIICTGVIEREVDGNKLKEANRYLYFRGDGYVEAGGRLAKDSVVDKLLFEGKSDYELAGEFINVIEEAMRKSTLSPMDVNVFKEKQLKETEERIEMNKQFNEEINKVPEIDVERNKVIGGLIPDLFKAANSDQKEKVKELMNQYGISKLLNFEENKTEGMEEILKVLS
ncbi:TPA: AAA family ATPase [Clostridium perfringens]|nr:AAA family ATPase [Clostridium perfringens]